MTHAQEANTQRIDWILRNWKPFASPESAAKDILKLFGKRRCQHIVRLIVREIHRCIRPWEAAEAILHIVEIAGNKRRRV